MDLFRLINQPKAVQLLVNTRPPRLLRLKNQAKTVPILVAILVPNLVAILVPIPVSTRLLRLINQPKDFKAYNYFMDTKFKKMSQVNFFPSYSVYIIGTDDGRVKTISQILYSQYHIWDFCALGTKSNIFCKKNPNTQTQRFIREG